MTWMITYRSWDHRSRNVRRHTTVTTTTTTDLHPIDWRDDFLRSNPDQQGCNVLFAIQKEPPGAPDDNAGALSGGQADAIKEKLFEMRTREMSHAMSCSSPLGFAQMVGFARACNEIEGHVKQAFGTEGPERKPTAG